MTQARNDAGHLRHQRQVGVWNQHLGYASHGLGMLSAPSCRHFTTQTHADNPTPHEDMPCSSWRTHAAMTSTTPSSSSCTICGFATFITFSSASGGRYAVRKVHSRTRLSISACKGSSSDTDWHAPPSNAGRNARSTIHQWYSVRSANCFAMATHTDTSMASDCWLCLLPPQGEPLADCRSASLSASRNPQPAACRMCRLDTAVSDVPNT
ncbi:hypothetical protein BX661DRAFT_38231 [Kickxella alabastrina]|uniref:uncharacterized protein n=1 Tax=Kickxella alabastrina TaxID=61397 RepID=UPI0022207241|nr:uncharacterized protein BX661DRAFT_38231 [Kickxella alabastrina]KAI7825430.1 hypothetical protein BX661DRAFT_38231 [Kickxella alabastrina]